MTATSFIVPGMAVTDHTLTVPLRWSDEDGPTIELFYREVVDPARAAEDLPLLVFLQGGPGGKGPRPMPGADWLPEALKHYRVVLPDQRGTGRSTPVDATVMAAHPDPAEAAGFLSCFLADSIIADVEHLRRTRYGVRWTSLGQSYGGFLTFAYLSAHPDALAASLITGGVPGVPVSADEVYRRTFPRARRKSLDHYRRYPQDVALVSAVADRLAEGDVTLPDGSPFSVRRLQSLGNDLGMKPGTERLHWLLDEAFAEPGRLSDGFLQDVLTRTSFAGNPLYWALQEFIYGDGACGALDWAAEREAVHHPDLGPDARPLLFTGEMTGRWMFDEITALRPFRPAVETLMRREEWPSLYDVEALAANEVPVQALVYADDLYVDSDLQRQTLDKTGNAQAWVTNEFEHDGVHVAGTFTRLHQLLLDRGGARR